MDPTFKLFGKANPSYERLIWSHEIVFHLKTSETDSFETMDRQHHILYPSHDPYECDEEIILKEIPDSPPEDSKPEGSVSGL